MTEDEITKLLNICEDYSSHLKDEIEGIVSELGASYTFSKEWNSNLGNNVEYCRSCYKIVEKKQREKMPLSREQSEKEREEFHQKLLNFRSDIQRVHETMYRQYGVHPHRGFFVPVLRVGMTSTNDDNVEYPEYLYSAIKKFARTVALINLLKGGFFEVDYLYAFCDEGQNDSDLKKFISRYCSAENNNGKKTHSADDKLNAFNAFLWLNTTQDTIKKHRESVSCRVFQTISYILTAGVAYLIHAMCRGTFNVWQSHGEQAAKKMEGISPKSRPSEPNIELSTISKDRLRNSPQ